MVLNHRGLKHNTCISASTHVNWFTLQLPPSSMSDNLHNVLPLPSVALCCASILSLVLVSILRLNYFRMKIQIWFLGFYELARQRDDKVSKSEKCELVQGLQSFLSPKLRVFPPYPCPIFVFVLLCGQTRSQMKKGSLSNESSPEIGDNSRIRFR